MVDVSERAEGGLRREEILREERQRLREEGDGELEGPSRRGWGCERNARMLRLKERRLDFGVEGAEELEEIERSWAGTVIGEVWS